MNCNPFQSLQSCTLSPNYCFCFALFIQLSCILGSIWQYNMEISVSFNPSPCLLWCMGIYNCWGMVNYLGHSRNLYLRQVVKNGKKVMFFVLPWRLIFKQTCLKKKENTILYSNLEINGSESLLQKLLQQRNWCCFFVIIIFQTNETTRG